MNNALKIQETSIKIGKKSILRDISFELDKNEICAILGANGSGKSTLLKAILGILDYSGSIEILEQECKNLSHLRRSKMLSYVPQSQHIVFPFSLLEVVMMGGFHKNTFSITQKDAQNAMQSLELLDIAHLADERFSTLSGGQKQLGLIARALTQDTPIIVLDEPVSALDISYSFKLLEILKHLKDKTILITSHHPEQCFIADKILMMKNGELFAFGAKEKILQESYINSLYNIQTKSLKLPNGGYYFCPTT